MPRQLCISDTVSGKIYARRPVQNGSEFGIEFIHSVNNSPVTDIFRVERDRIRPVAAKFFSYGAGMPSDLEPGQVLSREGDALVITGFSQSYRELTYIVGTVSDHILTIKDEKISLRDLCGKNAHIRIYISKL
ncbi:MAG: DUF1850 domain-containing protein [Treponema sp.]|nr:DUF1850 domain-containing protein [Treponema sp.]